jgi:hypothetical protein
MHRAAAAASASTVLGVCLLAAMSLAAGTGPEAHVASPAPNPADSAAWSRVGGGVASIAYNLPKAGHVHVRVYDAAGHEVAHPVNEWQSAGRHMTTFAFGPAPNQVFHYRVKCGRRISTGKVVTGP